MHPYSVDFRNRCLLETFPKSCRPYKCAFVKVRVRRFVGSGASQNRIIAIHHPLDSEDGLFNFSAGMIPRAILQTVLRGVSRHDEIRLQEQFQNSREWAAPYIFPLKLPSVVLASRRPNRALKAPVALDNERPGTGGDRYQQLRPLGTVTRAQSIYRGAIGRVYRGRCSTCPRRALQPESGTCLR